jgi:acyl carrier protein
MDRGEVERELRRFLSGLTDAEFDNGTSLVKSRLLSSLNLVELILWIEETFEVVLNPQDITAEEFDTPALMTDYILNQG